MAYGFQLFNSEGVSVFNNNNVLFAINSTWANGTVLPADYSQLAFRATNANAYVYVDRCNGNTVRTTDGGTIDVITTTPFNDLAVPSSGYGLYILNPSSSTLSFTDSVKYPTIAFDSLLIPSPGPNNTQLFTQATGVIGYEAGLKRYITASSLAIVVFRRTQNEGQFLFMSAFADLGAAFGMGTVPLANGSGGNYNRTTDYPIQVTVYQC